MCAEKIKIIIDASFLSHTLERATGLMLRDNIGSLLRGQAIWYGQAPNAMIMETLAVQDGVRLACDLGLSHTTLETNAKEVVTL